MSAYLVIVTWPNGIEGLLFPRPGNVKIASTPEEGQRDFQTALEHFEEFAKANPKPADKLIKIRLQRFEFKETISEVTL